MHHQAWDPHAGTAAATGEEGAGNRKDTITWPRAPEGPPGGLREHSKGPDRANPHRPREGQCDRPAGQSHRRGEGLPKRQQPQEMSRGRTHLPNPTDATRQRAGTVRSTGFRTPVSHAPPVCGEERLRGCRQNEKRGHVSHECQSLMCGTSCPSRENVTSPHPSLVLFHSSHSFLFPVYLYSNYV